MGRYKKYFTEEEKRKANLIKSTRYYLKNKRKIDEMKRLAYHKNKFKNS